MKEWFGWFNSFICIILVWRRMYCISTYENHINNNNNKETTYDNFCLKYTNDFIQIQNITRNQQKKSLTLEFAYLHCPRKTRYHHSLRA